MSEATTDAEEVVEEHTEQQEEATVSDCESASEEVDGRDAEQESTGFSDDFDSENEDEEQDESEDVGMAMSM